MSLIKCFSTIKKFTKKDLGNQVLFDILCRVILEKDIDKEKEVWYTYDEKGNLLSKTMNGERIEYKYAEGTDRLLKYGEESFAYDRG